MASIDTSIKYISLDNLELYHSLLEDKIALEDAKSLKTAALSSDGKKLLLYRESEPVGSATPAYEIEFPDKDISHLLEKFTNATSGDVVIVNDDGKTIKDSGVKLSDLATKSEVNAVDSKVDTNTAAIAENKQSIVDTQSDLNTFKGKVGEIPENKTVMGILDKIQADAYDDTELRGLISDNADDISALNTRTSTAEDKLTTLIGSDANKSVRTIANEELVKQLIPEGAKESLNTLQEIADWIQSHPDDAAAMNTAIIELKKYVGTIPEGVTATTIVGYIQEVIKAESDKLAALTDRVTAVETKASNALTKATANEESIGTINTTLSSHADRIKALEDEQLVISTATAEDIQGLFA